MPLRQANLLPAYKLSTLIPTSETVFSHIPPTLRDTDSMTLFQVWIKAHLLNHLPRHQTVPCPVALGYDALPRAHVCVRVCVCVYVTVIQ